MKFFYCLIFLFSNITCQKLNPSSLENDLKNISKGLGSLVAKKKLVKGSSKLINGIVDLTCDVCNCSQITAQDQKEIDEVFNLLLNSIDQLKLSQIKRESNSNGKMLAEGIGGLVYHTFKLAVFKEDIVFHVKNIVGSLLKIISYVLTESSPKEDELEQIKQNLNNLLSRGKFSQIKRSELNEDQLSIKQAFSLILNSLVNMALHPTQIVRHGNNILKAIIQVVQVILADGKIDTQDKENIQVALENLGKHKKA